MTDNQPIDSIMKMFLLRRQCGRAQEIANEKTYLIEYGTYPVRYMEPVTNAITSTSASP